jgi:hypothetical protein
VNTTRCPVLLSVPAPSITTGCIPTAALASGPPTQLVCCRAAGGGSGKGRGPPAQRAIIHLDMDCFFASAAAVGRPELQGVPLAVSHSNSTQGSGEVSAASYEARAFGIR